MQKKPTNVAIADDDDYLFVCKEKEGQSDTFLPLTKVYFYLSSSQLLFTRHQSLLSTFFILLLLSSSSSSFTLTSNAHFLFVLLQLQNFDEKNKNKLKFSLF